MQFLRSLAVWSKQFSNLPRAVFVCYKPAYSSSSRRYLFVSRCLAAPQALAAEPATMPHYEYRYEQAVPMSQEDPKVINFADYDAIGFDMDFTLVRYDLVPFFPMHYKHMWTILVEKGYDSSYFSYHEKDDDLFFKCLVTDFEKGNLLKLGEDGTVLRATHGSRKLTDEEIVQQYGPDRKFPHFEEFERGEKGKLKTWAICQTYFEVPCQVAFTSIVDGMEKMGMEKNMQNYQKIYDDVMASLRETFIPMDIAPFYAHMRTEKKRYVTPVSQQIKNWLKKLKRNNNKVFLLTSSYPEYSTQLMDFVYGEDWKSHFDLLIYGAGKPDFFTKDKPFMKIKDFKPTEAATELEQGGEYLNGNNKQLMEFLRKETNKENPKVIYVGDSLLSDARACKKEAGWDTILVLEEMDAEGYAVSDGTVPGHEGEYNKEGEPISKKKRAFLHSSQVTEEEMNLMNSEFWGSIFTDDKSKTQGKENTDNANGSEKTLTAFARFTMEYADICVPSIEYLAGVPVDHDFIIFDSNPYRGYHPGRPQSLCTGQPAQPQDWVSRRQAD